MYRAVCMSRVPSSIPRVARVPLALPVHWDMCIPSWLDRIMEF
jgi:hypothetical protein